MNNAIETATADTFIAENNNKSFLFYKCTICQGFLDSVDNLVAHWVIRHGITVTGQPNINKFQNSAAATTAVPGSIKLEELDYESFGQIITPATTISSPLSECESSPGFSKEQDITEVTDGLLSFTSLVPVIGLIKQCKEETSAKFLEDHEGKIIVNNNSLDDELRFLGQEIEIGKQQEGDSNNSSASDKNCGSVSVVEPIESSTGVSANCSSTNDSPPAAAAGPAVVERIQIEHIVSKLVEEDNIQFLFDSSLLDEEGKNIFETTLSDVTPEKLSSGEFTITNIKKGRPTQRRKRPLRTDRKVGDKRKMNLNLNQNQQHQNNAGYIDNRGWTPEATLYLPLPSPSDMLTESPGDSYCCPVCNIQFQTRSQLMGHTRKHMKDKLFQCKLCDQNFPTHKELKSHMADKNETDEFSITCGICQRTFPSQACLTHHLNCHKQAGSAPVIIDNPSAERRYSCSLCSKTFKNSQHVQRHLRIHTGEKPFSCLQCGQSFSLNHNLQRHMRTHTGEKPHKCPVCSKEFAEGHNLKRHMISAHDGPTPYICSICNRKFAENSILKKHQNKAHKNTSSNSNNSLSSQ